MIIQQCEDCGEHVPGSIAMMYAHKKNECESWRDEIITIPKNDVEEREIIKTILKEDKMERGNKYYVTSFEWLQLWKVYVGYDDDVPSSGRAVLTGSGRGGGPRKPSQIDNSGLLKRENFQELREDLQRGYDYELLSRKAWMTFKEWYGRGPEIPKKVILESVHDASSLRIDLYPINVFVKYRQGPDTLLKYSFYRLQTIIDLKYMITNDLYVRPHQCRLYLVKDNGEEIKMEKEHHKMTLDEMNIPSGSTIIISKDIDDMGTGITVATVETEKS